jgi:hypothetical protein
MTQKIDPAKLKAAAEHLERVLERCPDSAGVKGLLRTLSPLIEQAKEGRVKRPFDEAVIPCGRSFAEGMYTQYGNPSVDDAYYAYAAELRGGRSPQEEQLIADTQAIIDARNAHE